MRRSFLCLAPLLLLVACDSILTTSDTSGRHYATLRGTVTRTDGTPVANAPIGVSCVGTANEPFGLTTEANTSGAYQTDVFAPSFLAPLPGPTYQCRVLTPYTGSIQAEKSITLSVSTDFDARPTNTVNLTVP